MKTGRAAMGSLPDSKPVFTRPSCWGARGQGQRRVPSPLPILLPLSFVRDTRPLPEVPAYVEGHRSHSGSALRSSVFSPTQCPPPHPGPHLALTQLDCWWSSQAKQGQFGSSKG